MRRVDKRDGIRCVGVGGREQIMHGARGRMNCGRALLAGLLSVQAAVYTPLCAGAGMPREGRFDFNLCTFGKVDYPRHARDLMSGSVDRMAQFLREPAGKKDSASQHASRCAGSHEIAAGTYRDRGICAVTDADGDEWVMRYETATDLAGKWFTVGGTGKYEGMKATGEYRPVGNVPGVMAGGFKTCHHNTGTYRMK